MTRKGMIKRLDKLASEVCKLRDGRCLKCGSRDNLQCAHIVNRRHLNTRWYLGNLITLCYEHHIIWAHNNPDEFDKWVECLIGETNDFIHWLSQDQVKWTVDKMCEIEADLKCQKVYIGRSKT
jgi:hypothetical protein